MMPSKFWEKVDVRANDECWNWCAHLGRDGYGHVKVGKKVCKAHRVVFEHFQGSIPDGHCVRHKCDNRACVNPAHLESGTLADNNRDRDVRGRQVSLRGEEHGMARLSRDAVAVIRDFAHVVAEGKKHLADRFNVGVTTITDVMNRKTWK